MHIISRKTLRLAAQRHPDAQTAIDHWYRVAHRAEWQSIADARNDFPHADAVKVASGNTATVFNVAGNKFRLITVIHDNRSKIYIGMLLTHAEYSRHSWKGRL